MRCVESTSENLILRWNLLVLAEDEIFVKFREARASVARRQEPSSALRNMAFRPTSQNDPHSFLRKFRSGMPQNCGMIRRRFNAITTAVLHIFGTTQTEDRNKR